MPRAIPSASSRSDVVRRHLAASLLIASVALAPNVVRADAAADRKAELDRKKEEARKKAEERAKAKAAEAAATGGKTGTGGAGSGGASAATAGATSKGGASAAATGGAGGTAGKGGAGGAGGKTGAGGATSKAEEKDAPLPAVDIETLRKDRPDRRKSTVERLRKRWGSLLANPAGTADLKTHARRVAFLQRVRLVADSKKDVKSVEAVDELLTQEDERHTSAMNALREGALPSGTKP
jgi:hypothetical protein